MPMNFFFGIFFILKTCKKKMFPSLYWKILVFDFPSEIFPHQVLYVYLVLSQT